MKIRKRPLIMVEWEDTADYGKWIDENESAKQDKPLLTFTVGWQLKSDRKKLIVTAMRNEYGDCADRNAIPKGCIKSIRRLE